MRKIVITIFCFLSITLIAQKKKSTSLGKTTLEELKMTVYDKDSTATAVVLYEHANYYVNAQKQFKKTTDYYFRVKILKKEAFDKATVKISLFGKEEVGQIEARTYNISGTENINESLLTEDKIFTNQVSEKWKEVTFALPNVKVGSVIEYVYSVTSPYSQINDWYFQSDIPKIKSDFTAAILGNYKYNIRVVGSLKLTTDSATVKKNCVYVPIIGNGNCLVLSYAIDNVPAFIEEDYMLSKKNYISRVSFERVSYTGVNGRVTKFAKTWKDADKALKNNILDNQMSKKKYFKKNILNEKILATQNNLEKAKQIFELIKDNYNWNGKYWPSLEVNIKKAYESKSGNVFDINLSLYNALQAAGIESELTLLALRDKGLPTKLYPTVDGFDYLVVRAVVDGKVYFLDATKKNMPFGLIQFEALNGEGRVMDFKNGSFWEDVTLSQKTTKTIKTSLELTEGKIIGDIIVSSTGYSALNKREELTTIKEEEVLSNFETKHPDIEVEDFKVENLKEFNKKLLEKYNVNIETGLIDGNRIIINPFILDRIAVNPFKLKSRDYPVDYGYPRESTYLLTFKIPEKYTIKKLPESKVLNLPNKGGRFIFNINEKNNSINLYLRISINKKVYSSKEYFYLKEFYNQIIKIEDSFIELEKK